MNKLELLIDSVSEPEKTELKELLKDCVKEYNTIRDNHKDVNIFTDELNSHNPVQDVLSGLSESFYYGLSCVKSFLSTAADYGIVAMGNVSNYVADYLDDGDNSSQEEVGDAIPSEKVLDQSVIAESVSPEESSERSIERKTPQTGNSNSNETQVSKEDSSEKSVERKISQTGNPTSETNTSLENTTTNEVPEEEAVEELHPPQIDS